MPWKGIKYGISVIFERITLILLNFETHAFVVTSLIQNLCQWGFICVSSHLVANIANIHRHRIKL